ncbi:TetR/AcrR family transcriptional regulator [Aeromicrobium sp.]|uniref:TetR/AcrR family transcriptional regulator n=1 Tax=Aeromicrobium sp. TaxID=1871063 RepID=UPI003C3F3B8F
MPRRSQEERRSTTRAALLAAGRELFATRGFADVPAEQIVRTAGVTRGAMYHHFDDKTELFAAVFEQLEAEITADLAASLTDVPADELVPTAVSAFLDICARPDVLRIALTDAPATLGWQRWREVEQRHGLGLVNELLSQRAEATGADVPPLLGQVVLGAVIEAALLIAHADDPVAARREAEASLGALLAGLGGEGGAP